MRAVGYACVSVDERTPEISVALQEKLGVLFPGASLDVQRSAIADACERRGWQLGNIHIDVRGPEEPDGRGGHARAIQELEDGRADVLVAAKLGSVGPWTELVDVLERGERQGWSILALDFNLDSRTPYGASALRTLGEHALTLPDCNLPVPPAELMFRVVGTDSPDRFEVGGRLQVQELDNILSAHGPGLGGCAEILDFGCGPGRLLRHLRTLAPQARLCGAEQDAEAIAWMRRRLPFVETAIAAPLPPLAFSDSRFDLVVVYSVFTHLDEAYQDAWLAEMHRLVRPGGYVLATVHGPGKWEEIRNGPMSGAADLDRMATEFESRGFLHWTGDDWAAFFPDYYHTSFHRSGYIRERWGRWFAVMDVVQASQHLPGDDILYSGHDIVVMRPRRERPSNSA